MRSTAVAYLLWFFLGLLGVHRFYCGRVGTGVLWFLTGGLFVVGWLVDLFLVPAMVREANALYLSQHGSYDDFDAPRSPRRAMYPANAGEHRLLYCTRCGSPMQVPFGSTGTAFACPACKTILRVPA